MSWQLANLKIVECSTPQQERAVGDALWIALVPSGEQCVFFFLSLVEKNARGPLFLSLIPRVAYSMDGVRWTASCLRRQRFVLLLLSSCTPLATLWGSSSVFGRHTCRLFYPTIRYIPHMAGTLPRTSPLLDCAHPEGPANGMHQRFCHLDLVVFLVSCVGLGLHSQACARRPQAGHWRPY